MVLFITAFVTFSLIEREVSGFFAERSLYGFMALQAAIAVLVGVSDLHNALEVAVYACFNTAGLVLQVVEHYRSKRRGDSAYATMMGHIYLLFFFICACGTWGDAHILAIDDPKLWGMALVALEILAAWLFRKQLLGLFSRQFDQQTQAMVAGVVV